MGSKEMVPSWSLMIQRMSDEGMGEVMWGGSWGSSWENSWETG